MLAARIKSANVEVTSPIAKDLREAIEAPAQLVGLKFDDYVVDSIVHDIVGERAAFTLLQFTMKRLWMRRTHNRITFKTLQDVGAGRKAVVRAAQAFYQELPPDRQQLLRPILVRLGSVADTVTTTWRTLVDASADPVEADNLLKELLQADLITVSTVRLAEVQPVKGLSGWFMTRSRIGTSFPNGSRKRRINSSTFAGWRRRRMNGLDLVAASTVC